MEFEIGSIDVHRPALLEYIRQEKAKGSFKVIDVGGSAGSITSGLADVIVDIVAENSDTNFKMDICDPEQWEVVLNHVQEHGKFDFCICSHTLEDIFNPYVPMKMFPKIAKRGIIMVPYFTTELSHPESPTYIGYIHHRYLFKEKDGKILVAPKMPFLENLHPVHHQTPQLINFQIKWEDHIAFDMFMGNYLGPSPQAVIDAFLNEFSQ